MGRGLIIALALAGLAVAAPTGAVAQGAGTIGAVNPTPRDPAYDALFAAVLRDPGNIDLSFRFAEEATRRGDVEAAIGALERINFYNPNLPRVKLELGVLYFRLASYEMARGYFESAVAGTDTPAEVRFRVAGFLREIDRRLDTNQFSVFGQFGVRYQTNANAGPTSSLVRAAGVDATLDRRFVRAPDGNVFALGGFRHLYDLGSQAGHLWETTVGVYSAKQFRFDRLDFNLAEIQTGPRLFFAPDALPGWSVRPYATTGAVSLGGHDYLTSYGAGASVTAPLSGYALLEPFVEVRERRFANTPDYVNANEQTGHLWTTGLLISGDLVPGAAPLRWQARLAYARNDTRREYTSFEAVGFDIGFPVEFTGPWGQRRWFATPSVGFGRTIYDQPNAVVDPFVNRVDKEFRVGMTLDMPLYQQFGLAAQIQYAVVHSSLPNYDTNNLSLTFGPTFRF